MLSRNKKASTTLEMVLWIARIFFLVAVVLSVFILIRIFIITNIDTFETDANLFIQRVIFSKSLNFYDNDINRLHVGTIDLKNFQAETIEDKLAEEISYGPKKVSAKISLENLNQNIKYNSIFYKRDLYEEKKELVGLSGPGGARLLIKELYVLILNGNNIEKGLLSIEVVIPNS